MARVLAVLRLSNSTEESTSIERQIEAIRLWCKLHGHDLVGEAEDDGVSGKTSHFDREGFGPWLKAPKLDEWDIAVGLRIDRLGRSVYEFLRLVKFLDEHGKGVATTDNMIDTSTPQGRFFAVLLVALAEWRREMDAELAKESQAKLRSVGRWGGGRLPFWLQVEGKGGDKHLTHIPERAQILRELIKRRLGGETQPKLAKWLNDNGVKTSLGRRWTSHKIGLLFRSTWLVGQRVFKGKLITDTEGKPVLFAPPILTESEFAELQRYQESRRRKQGTRGTPYLLRTILHCGICGSVMYRQNETRRPTHYYKCSSLNRDIECSNRQYIRADYAEDTVSRVFLDHKGPEAVLEPVFIQGEDHTRQLEQIVSNITRMRAEADAGLWEGALDDYMDRMTALSAERKRLSGLPQRPDRVEMRATETTYAESWATEGVEGRRQLLVDMSVKAWVYPNLESVANLPEADEMGNINSALLTEVGQPSNRKWIVATWHISD